MSASYYTPIAVFDTLKDVIEQYKTISESETPRKVIRQWLQHCFVGSKVNPSNFAAKDYQAILNFLYNYRGSTQTFNAYRRELERLAQWAWFVQEQSIFTLKREQIESFVQFCIKPYKRWIGTKTIARFKKQEGIKIPNPQWRPFEASISKKAVKSGQTATKEDYEFSQKSLQALFAILGSFYHYLLQEEIVTANPVKGS